MIICNFNKHQGNYSTSYPMSTQLIRKEEASYANMIYSESVALL
jgi:hypothetical protein